MNRYILVITYSFPPAGGSGVQRILKFVKYLPQFGWQPVVLTADSDAYPILDKTLIRDVPDDTPIYRVASPDVNRLRPAFTRLKLGKILSAINLALMLPDATIFWARKARSVAEHIIEQYQPALVFSSLPPPSAHLLALWMQRRFHLPWVADFRDPWTQNPQTLYYPGYRFLNQRLERQVLVQCDRLVTVSPPLVDMLEQLSNKPASAVHLIENGYDEDDVHVLPPPRTQRFTITYTGTFSRLRQPDAFIAAVDQLIETARIPRGEIRIAMAGKNVADYIPRHPPYEQLGYLNHAALSDLRRESNLLLLIIDESPASRGNYSGKVFEHLGCNRPTLCIAHPDNVAARLIERTNAGFVVRSQPDEIAQAILDAYRAWKTGTYTYAPDWSLIRQFSRRKQTRRLAEIFDQLTHE